MLAASSTSVAADRPSGRLGRDPDIDRLGPGVRRDLRVGSPGGAPRRGSRRPATRRCRSGGTSWPPRRDRGRLAAGAAAPGRPTSGASRAAVRAGRRSTRPSGTATTQPGAVPFGLGRAVARRDEPRLLEIDSGNGSPRRAHSARSQRSRTGSTTGVSPQTGAMASRVRSSGVGPRPPVETTRSDPLQAGRERLGDDLQSIRQRRDPPDRDARRRSASGRAPPAFVSRVSPTVSSEPMLSSSAVRSRRAGRPADSVAHGAA